MKNSGVQSAWSFVVQTLIETPGLTYREVAENRPEHLTLETIQVMCNKLYREGILLREKPSKISKGGNPSFRYQVGDLSKIPKSWRESGKSMPEARGQKKDFSAGKMVSGRVAVGFSKIAKLSVENRPKVEAKVFIPPPPSRKFISVVNKYSLKLYPPKKEIVVQVPELAKALAKVEESPRKVAGILLEFPSGQKRLSVATAKSLYFQLKEIFE